MGSESVISWTNKSAKILAQQCEALCLLSPINRFPTEIFSIIFKFAVDADLESPYKLPELKTPLTLISVSKSWRDIALATPSLWTRVNILNAHLAPLFVARSKDLPLGINLLPIEFSASTPATKRHLDLYSRYSLNSNRLIGPLISHIHRWEEFYVNEISPTDLIPLLSSPAPQLVGFSAMVRRGGAWPSHLFADHTPRLRYLSLGGFHIPLTSSMYIGLISLCLERIRYPSDSLPEFLGNLASCPSLERLVLSDICFTEERSHYEPGRLPPPSPTLLQHLASLELDGLEENILQNIFASFRFPPTLKMLVRAPPIHQGFRSIFPLDYDFATHAPFLFSHTLSVRDSFDITCEFSRSPPLSLRDCSVIKLLATGQDPSHITQVLRGIAQDLPLRSVEVLTIMGGHPRSPHGTESWINVLRSMPMLTSLTLTTIPPLVADALILTPNWQICPRIVEMTLQDFDISKENLIKLATSRTMFENSPDGAPPEGSARLRSIVLKGCTSLSFVEHGEAIEATKAIFEALSLRCKWTMTLNEIDQVIEE